jgi:hypothetical protein
MADDDAIRHVGILRDELLGGVFRREYEQGCASVGSSIRFLRWHTVEGEIARR